MLILAVSSAASAAEFSFRSGITWNTTPEQMLSAEGLAPGDGSYNEKPHNGYRFFYLKAHNVYYVYRGEQLLQAYTVLSADAYAAELDRRTALYGAPNGAEAQAVEALWNSLYPGGLTPGAAADTATWRLSDGTLAALFLAGGETCMSYFNEQSILAGE
ncbi:MAG: hypothetical protein IH607_06820 [Firmicutes bacterium]|nr:hypothetical protein [Bacillota bacterium]